MNFLFIFIFFFPNFVFAGFRVQNHEYHILRVGSSIQVNPVKTGIHFAYVIPAKAGISSDLRKDWIPAFAYVIPAKAGISSDLRKDWTPAFAYVIPAKAGISSDLRMDWIPAFAYVIPAKAGISSDLRKDWIPAFAGMTSSQQMKPLKHKMKQTKGGVELPPVRGISKNKFRKIAKLLKDIPVQAGGRVKPLDTFSRESIRHVYGKVTSDYLHWVMTWLLMPEEWLKKPFIWIEKAQVKKALGLEEKKSHFSPLELFKNKNFQREIGELDIRREQKEKLNSYFLELEKVESRLALFQALAEGRFPGWMPPQSVGTENFQWLNATQLIGQQREALRNVFNAYSSAVHTGAVQDLKKATTHLKTLSVSNRKMQAEVHYNSIKPFRWGWCFYFISLIVLLFSALRKYFFIPLGMGFLIHTYGIALRSYIMSRPPVSNMFETLLWVPWAALVMAFVFMLIRKKQFPLRVGAVVSFLCLFISDTASSILNDQLEPLEAVLRSNFWLSTHVLIITMSYSAFFLAFIMSDFLAFKFLMGYKQSRNHFWFLQRVLQAGVFLLTLGTILGAVWADYSWGRFWGWDPKEVWALVSLLGYLALLHAKLQGWIREFGLTLGSILCFFLIIMAWYGVNFVLGKGLHSYGFGTGGFSYVLVFVLVHFLFLYFVWRKKKNPSFEA